jgi:hypothetical protein
METKVEIACVMEQIPLIQVRVIMLEVGKNGPVIVNCFRAWHVCKLMRSGINVRGWCSSLNMLCVVKHDYLFSGTHTE